MALKKKSNNVLDLVSKEDLVERLENVSQELESMDKQIFEMRTLLQSGKGLGNILKLDQLFITLLAIIREKYHLVNSSVLLIDTDQGIEQRFFRIFTHHGIPEEYHFEGRTEHISQFKFPVADGLLWQIINNGETFTVQDRKRQARFTQAWHEWNLSVLYSDVWCPLIVKGEVIGVITLGPKKNGKQIQESEFSFINDLLAIAVTNIDSVMKYEKNQAILKNVRILYEANQHLADIQDTDLLCLKSLRTIIKGINAQAGELLLKDQKSNELILKAKWNQKNDSNYIIDQKYWENVQDQKSTLRIRDKENISQTGSDTVHSLQITPLFKGNEVVGAVNLYNKIDESFSQEVDLNGFFSSDDESLVNGLGDQLVANLHKLNLYYESITDSLTGLYNTGHYQKEIERLVHLAKKNRSPISVAVLDIDYFKTFNDDHGHKAGDAVLHEFGNIFKNFIKNNEDLLAFRYGGEEFCLIMPNMTETEGYQFINEFREIVCNHNFNHDNNVFKVTISGGVAALSEENKTASEIFLAADKVLYKSKKDGRNKITATKVSKK